jgi:protein TonB
LIATVDSKAGEVCVSTSSSPTSESSPVQEKSDSAKPPSAASMGSRVTSGKLIHKVQPEYPPEAMNARIEGTVVLQATIGKDGKVGNLQVISGPKELIPSAMKAVEQWRYQPYLVNNEPVEVETQVEVIFQLNH